MSILDRDSLEQSPLADLHVIASELSIDGYRRLRKADLIDAILARQEGEAAEVDTEPEEQGAEEQGAEEHGGDEGESSSRRRRWRRGARGRGPEESDESPEQPPGAEDHGPESEQEADRAEPEETESTPRESTPKSSRSRSSRSRSSRPEASRSEPSRPDPSPPEPSRSEAEAVEGVVELLAGGSGFVRVHPPEPSDDDVYISSAQIKRCELVTGDRVSGPRRAPRRSERFASLLRVDTVNGRPASELADSVRFEDRPAAFPNRRLDLAQSDHGLAAIERTAPFGRGSRVTIFGPPASGKTAVLRRVAAVLEGDPALKVWVVLAGVRPEELAEWEQGGHTPAVSLSFAASSDAQSQALDGVVEQVRRLVARGGDAVLLIDTLDGVIPGVARKALASSRNLLDGGSLTVIATASAPLGGETTAIALERPQPGTAEFPAVDAARSWTIRDDLLG